MFPFCFSFLLSRYFIQERWFERMNARRSWWWNRQKPPWHLHAFWFTHSLRIGSYHFVSMRETFVATCGRMLNNAVNAWTAWRKFQNVWNFVHDKMFELISRTIRELCANYAQTSRTSACQCVPMRVHRPSDTLFTTSSRLSYEYFAH